jgi:DNA replication protein DnaC
MSDVSETVEYETLTGQCACGAEVVREIPVKYKGRRYFSNWRDAPFVCEGCHKAEDDRRQAESQAEQAATRLWFNLRSSGLPESRQLHLDALDHPAETLGACRSWVRGGGGLMLTGEVGRGKTTLAGAAVYEMLHHQSVTWTSMPELFAKLARSHGHPDREWALDLVTGNSALALDDLDKARDTDYGVEQVFLAIDRRVEHRLPLLVTSNLSPGGLAERYGDAIASRLVGYCTVVKVGGVDRRLA